MKTVLVFEGEEHEMKNPCPRPASKSQQKRLCTQSECVYRDELEGLLETCRGELEDANEKINTCAVRERTWEFEAERDRRVKAEAERDAAKAENSRLVERIKLISCPHCGKYPKPLGIADALKAAQQALKEDN